MSTNDLPWYRVTVTWDCRDLHDIVDPELGAFYDDVYLVRGTYDEAEHLFDDEMDDRRLLMYSTYDPAVHGKSAEHWSEEHSREVERVVITLHEIEE